MEEDSLLFEGPKEKVDNVGDLDLCHCLLLDPVAKNYVALSPMVQPSNGAALFEDITISIWAKIFSHNQDTHNRRTYIFDLRGDGRDSNQGACLSLEHINGETELHCYFCYAPRKWTELCGVIDSPLQQWTHFAFTRKGLCTPPTSQRRYAFTSFSL